jgi:DNA-directed RNA polymerase subunit M/transcription elongation factor TFIIS
MKESFVDTIRNSILHNTPLLVFPLTRVKVIENLVSQHGLTPEQAMDYEYAAHQFSAGKSKWYIPVVQYMMEEIIMDVLPATVITRYVEEVNTPLPEITDPVLECIQEIEESEFKCTVPGADEGGRRCIKQSCGSTDLEAVGVQTRSLDEGQTIMYKCRNCGEKFR